MSISDIITKQWMIDNYLFGINLTGDEDDPYPDSLFEHSRDAAIDAVSEELDVVLDGNLRYPFERHDVSDWENETWYLLHADHRPVRSVLRGGVRFGAFQKTTFPRSWMHVSSSLAGQVQILPGPEGLEGWSYSGGIPILAADVLTVRPYTPRWLWLDYVAGFEHDVTGTVTAKVGDRCLTGTGTDFLEVVNGDEEAVYEVSTILRKGQYVKVGDEVRRIHEVTDGTTLVVDLEWKKTWADATLTLLDYPHSILDMVGLVAALLPLDTAGDLIIGAGISTLSISVDGISQSIGTTSGVENSGYGARMISYQKRLQSHMETSKRKYRPVRMFAL